MDSNSSLTTTNSVIADKEVEPKTTIKKYPIPSYQDVLTKIQQQAIDHNELIVEAQKEDISIGTVHDFTTLLQADKQKAQKIISKLVSSAKEITSTITNSLTSVPIHPYEKLIYEYLGPKFVPKSIHEYSIPDNYNPYKCIKDLRVISEANHQLQMSQMAQLTAEAMQPTFDGTFVTENLNNAFAEPVIGSDGKQQFVINEVRLKEHLEFVEMVKAIPTDYIFKNPIEVAKKMLSEFIRIHKPANAKEIKDEMAVSNFTVEELIKNPNEAAKQLFGNYQQLTNSDHLDFIKLFENLQLFNQQNAKIAELPT